MSVQGYDQKEKSMFSGSPDETLMTELNGRNAHAADGKSAYITETPTSDGPYGEETREEKELKKMRALEIISGSRQRYVDIFCSYANDFVVDMERTHGHRRDFREMKENLKKMEAGEITPEEFQQKLSPEMKEKFEKKCGKKIEAAREACLKEEEKFAAPSRTGVSASSIMDGTNGSSKNTFNTASGAGTSGADRKFSDPAPSPESGMKNRTFDSPAPLAPV